jgi:predicted DNA-binding transcriptional regulator YafY
VTGHLPWSTANLTLPVRNARILDHVRASRLVNVLLLLQTRSRMTAAELADELEVSVRTIYRDVEALAEAGVPIYAERGPHGGVRLVDGYRTRLTGLTAEEAEAVFLSGVPGPAAELGLGTVVAAARLKVMAALPPELRTRASRVSERFHLDAPGWFQPDERLPHLEALAGAVWDTRRVKVRYRRGERSGDVDRLLDPMGLVLKGGIWYLLARHGEDIRTYRISRVRAVEVLGERFERPADFDLAEHWAGSTAAYERTRDNIEIVLRLPVTRTDALADACGGRVLSQAVRLVDPSSDHLRLRLRFDWDDEAIVAAFRLAAADAEVLEPDWIRRAVVTSAEAALATYAVGSAAARPG